MREIKFRAWDKHKEEMIKDWIPFSAFTLNESFSKSSLNIMQFTGLLDKQGVEIYEGDIVRLWDDYICFHKGAVEYGESYPAFDVKGHNLESNALSMFSIGEDLHIEVIGNIYENTELLEK